MYILLYGVYVGRPLTLRSLFLAYYASLLFVWYGVSRCFIVCTFLLMIFFLCRSLLSRADSTHEHINQYLFFLFYNQLVFFFSILFVSVFVISLTRCRLLMGRIVYYICSAYMHRHSTKTQKKIALS